METLILTLAVAAFIWWLVEKSRRRTHPVRGGIQKDRVFPHEAEFELYHNALSLCSMKTRLCMAELGVPYKSHHIDLIETGCYENIRPKLLDVNPAGTVPVLLHNGHPVYESHEQIRYAAQHAPAGTPALVPEDPSQKAVMDEWIDRSSITDDPLNNMDISAGNAVPGQTLPLFCTMIEKIPYFKIFEGFLFHFDKFRPMLFTLLKLRGLGNLGKLKPAAQALARSRAMMFRHIDALEAQLGQSAGPWILGEQYSLADVSWLVIFERMRQADCEMVFLDTDEHPQVAAYWQRLKGRPAYQVAILDQSHPLIEYGRDRIVEGKAANPEVRILLEGS